MVPSRDNHPSIPSVRPSIHPSTYRFKCSKAFYSDLKQRKEKKGKREREKKRKRKRERENQKERKKERKKREKVKKRKREKEKKEKKTNSRNGLGRAPTYNRKILRRVSTNLYNLSICHQSIHLSYHL